MPPNLDHLFWLRHDPDAFEHARNKLISDHIKSVPEEHRTSAYLMQLKIDEARMRLPNEEFLKWLTFEAEELRENLEDQLIRLRNVARDLQAVPKSST